MREFALLNTSPFRGAVIREVERLISALRNLRRLTKDLTGLFGGSSIGLGF